MDPVPVHDRPRGRVSALLDRIPVLSLRAKLILLPFLFGLIAVQPLLEAHRELDWHLGAHGAYQEVPLACSIDADDPSEQVARYLETRPAAVDRLVPAGAGGTRFFRHLDGNAGMAFRGIAAAGLAVDVGLGRHSVSTEVHELAHLMQFCLAPEVARLMRGLPAPVRDEYAAKNSREHFAEMAASAWEIVDLLDPTDFCVNGASIDWLRDMDQRVPGTAGFVAWYLRHLDPAEADAAEELRIESQRLIQPHRDAWEAIFAALDARRLPDGTFRPWEPASSVRAYLEAQLEDARMEGGLGGRITAAQVTTSLAVLGFMERRGL
jgi:hypothetical protein